MNLEFNKQTRDIQKRIKHLQTPTDYINMKKPDQYIVRHKVQRCQ